MDAEASAQRLVGGVADHAYAGGAAPADAYEKGSAMRKNDAFPAYLYSLLPIEAGDEKGRPHGYAVLLERAQYI
ncbi:hypothetical protein ACOJBO_16765 [Rhizobium beringeri]